MPFRSCSGEDRVREWEEKEKGGGLVQKQRVGNTHGRETTSTPSSQTGTGCPQGFISKVREKAPRRQRIRSTFTPPFYYVVTPKSYDTGIRVLHRCMLSGPVLACEFYYPYYYYSCGERTLARETHDKQSAVQRKRCGILSWAMRARHTCRQRMEKKKVHSASTILYLLPINL